ncbi:MAG TPA: glycosyltransferase family A protein [Bryobacteraceae bacterium]|nr:glycosyltransferase family A protein [Bryobacteraceae bacterium]
MITVVAIICVRNEFLHIRRCIRDFIDQGIDVILIDNDSSDDTIVKANDFLGKGLLRIQRLPWTGAFSLTDQLACKHAILKTVRHDWVIHADADEWLSAPGENERLLEGIAAADRDGATCINFNEFTFVPEEGREHLHECYSTEMLSYYFFRPEQVRLMRAWKRKTDLDNCSGAGHLLLGRDLRLHVRTFILRHYIALGLQHARAKYVGRRFSEEDVAKGWHGNRMNLCPNDFRLSNHRFIQRLPAWSSKSFCTDTPVFKHFWQWSTESRERTT